MSDTSGASRKKTDVSVVMSVWNGARFLDKSIQSIRDQSFSNFEFVIIDDGSVDATPEIIARHASEDSRLSVMSQQNRGLIESLHRGFAAAKGKYIARMDADDVAKPYRLQMQFDFLTSNPGIALIGGAIEIIDSESKVLATVRSPSHPEGLRRELRECGNAIAHPTVMFRRRALEEVGGFRRAYQHAEDYDLWLRMVEKFDLANLEAVLLGYRRHEAAISHQHIKQQALSALCARTTAKLRLKGHIDPTSNMDLITESVLRGLGVPKEAVDEAILRNIRLQVEDAIRSGCCSAAADFVRMARPHAPADKIACMSLELNLKAANASAPAFEKRRHRLMLLTADPATYWELFKPGSKYSNRQPI